MVDLVTMMESNVFRTSSTLRLLPGKEETVVCVAFSEAFPIERVSSPVKLRVRHPPSVSLTFTSPPTISIGETFELECQASAYPANLTYVWTVDGKKLEDEKGKSLKLEHVNKEADGSIVTCQVIRIIKTDYQILPESPPITSSFHKDCDQHCAGEQLGGKKLGKPGFECQARTNHS